jgi:hypothetical protein
MLGAGFAGALQSSAFDQLPGQVQFSQKQSYKELSSCQTFAQYKFLQLFFLLVHFSYFINKSASR